MENVTILWSLGAAVALILAVVYGIVWLIERRDPASLLLFILGLATAASAYVELGMMHSSTASEYGEWGRWYHLPFFFAVIAQLLLVHYYLGTGRLWLMWAIIFARSVVIAVNFSVHPSVNFSNIVSLRSVSLLGEKVSVIGVAVPRSGWQWFAIASLILLLAYFVDAAARRWLKGEPESRRKALAVSLGVVAPLLCNFVYNQLLISGVLHSPLSVLPGFLGVLLMMAYELGRDSVLSKRTQLQLAETRVQLAQVDRVSIMGQLASTLAHELAQPLTSASANADAARRHLRNEQPDLKELREILADISSDQRRASEIIDRMRELLKRHTIHLGPLGVEEVVQDVVSLVHSEVISKNVVLDVLMQPGLPRVLSDRVHLSQVLLNLLMNSIHAVKSRPADARHIVVEARTDDAKGEVEMAVRDSGPGIPDIILDKLFKPFFTTKADGLGMGLALSRTIIEGHGGRLWTDHGLQQDGAIFRFTLRQA